MRNGARKAMVASPFRWFVAAVATLVFGGLLVSPFHSSERALLAEPGLLYAFDHHPVLSRGLHLALHLAALWLAAGLFERLPTLRAARLALLLYAIHPLHTQSLASLEARPHLLAALLSLAALRLWTRGHLWPALTFAIPATLAAPAALALPLVLWLWASPEDRRISAAPLGLLSGVGLAALLHGFNPSAVSLTAPPVVLLQTLFHFLLPAGLSADPELRTAPLAVALAAAVLVTFVYCLWRLKTAPRLWLASALLGLVPAPLLINNTAVPAGAAPHAALALLFLCGAAGWLLAQADARLLAPAAALFAVVTLLQVHTWQSERAVWLDAVRAAPRKASPRLRLAPLVEPRFALELLEQARRDTPDDPALALEFAAALARAGRPVHAAVEWEMARRLSGCAPSLRLRLNQLTPAGQPQPCLNSPEPSH